MKKANYFLYLLIFLPFILKAEENLKINPEDLRIEKHYDGGFHLYIKKKKNIASVLLTESSADPEGKLSSFALRNPKWEKTNGNEKRILDGKYLPEDIYSLIDSSPEKDKEFGEAFHIFIPYQVNYGYSWTRQGTIEITNGTWLCIRSFEKPYADYSGNFFDNPFILKRISIKKKEDPESKEIIYRYNKKAADDFDYFSGGDKKKSLRLNGKEDLKDKIRTIITETDNKNTDIVFVVDTTESMKEELKFIRPYLLDIISQKIHQSPKSRVGFVLYKDYMEAYLNKVLPFEKDYTLLKKNIFYYLKASGGRDIPEAVQEAMEKAVNSFPWANDKRLIILIGDAPGHPDKNNKRKEILSRAEFNKIEIYSLLVPF